MESSARNSDPELRREQLKQLYLSQKQTLDTFLNNGAITKAQYDKSLGDLTRKMGMENEGTGAESGKLCADNGK